MTEDNFEISELIKKYFYGVSASIHKLLQERENENTSLSKELVAKLKSARKKPEKGYLIYYALAKYHFSSHLNAIHLPKYCEEEIDETIRILVPIQVELGFSKEDSYDSYTNKSFGNSLASFLSHKENNRFETLEKKFLDILSSPREHFSNRFFPILSVLKSSSTTQSIHWPKLYFDIFNWENSRKVQNQWAKDFYKNLNAENNNK